MTAIAMILAAKWILLLSVLGAFVLAYMAVQAPDMAKIAILMVWCVGIILPIAYLYLKGGASHGDGS